MNQGFFIVVVKAQSARTGGGGKRKEYFRADLLHPVKGWAKTSGETMQAVAERQKEQYDSCLALKKLVPDLVNADCSPMAIGQTVRFVTIV